MLSRHSKLRNGAGFGNLLAGIFEKLAKLLQLREAGGGEFSEERFHLGVLGEGGVAKIETGGAFFGSDDEFHGFIETGIIAGVNEAGADADGELVFRRKKKAAGGGDALQDQLEPIALLAFVVGHAFERCAQFRIAGLFGKDDVAVGGDGFAEGGDGERLVVGGFGEVGVGKLFAHVQIIIRDEHLAPQLLLARPASFEWIEDIREERRPFQSLCCEEQLDNLRR